jgi:diaminohydroxyphosphoribosylaminopyrimidine deaminase/5-amino-6-(5-phosphoribosylamino)uracil reductase
VFTIFKRISKVPGYFHIDAPFDLTADIVDYYLCYLAPTLGGNSSFNKVDDKFEILNTAKEAQDIIMWMKREI